MALPFSKLNGDTLSPSRRETLPLAEGSKASSRKRDKVVKSEEVNIFDYDTVTTPVNLSPIPFHEVSAIREVHQIFEKERFRMMKGEDLRMILDHPEMPDHVRVLYLLEAPALAMNERLIIDKLNDEHDRKMQELRELEKLIKEKEVSLEQQQAYNCMLAHSASECAELLPSTKEILLKVSKVLPKLFTDAMKFALLPKKIYSNVLSSKVTSSGPAPHSPSEIQNQKIESIVLQMNSATGPGDRYVKTTQDHALKLVKKYPFVTCAQHLVWAGTHYTRADNGPFVILTHVNDKEYFVNALRIHLKETTEELPVGLFTPDVIARFFKK